MLSEECFELLFGSSRIHILDDQVEHLHGLLELVSAFLQFQCTLLFGLSLSHIEIGLGVDLLLFAGLAVRAKLIQGFLSILPVFEAHEPKAPALLVLILHDHGTHDFTEVSELSFQVLVSEVSRWEVLHVEVGAASRLLESIAILLRHVLGD